MHLDVLLTNPVPFVNNIMYITRSVHDEENEQVVLETLDRYGVEWGLQRVIPELVTDPEFARESNRCLTILPSETTGNGIFLAQFSLKKPAVEEEEEPVVDAMETMSIGEIEHTKTKQTKRNNKSADKHMLGRYQSMILKKIPKHVVRAVERLSVPRRYMGEVIGTSD
jgi:hypothetical protein